MIGHYKSLLNTIVNQLNATHCLHYDSRHVYEVYNIIHKDYIYYYYIIYNNIYIAHLISTAVPAQVDVGAA